MLALLACAGGEAGAGKPNTTAAVLADADERTNVEPADADKRANVEPADADERENVEPAVAEDQKKEELLDREKESAEKTEQTEDIRLLELFVGNQCLEEWSEDFVKLCSAEWQHLILSEEDAKEFPALAAALKEMNTGSDVGGYSFMEYGLADAKEEFSRNPEYFNGYSNEYQYYVQRADEHILSIVESGWEYTGGVHGMYESGGINFDPSTGKRLELTDILTDTEGIRTLLIERLKETYLEVPFYGLEELILKI